MMRTYGFVALLAALAAGGASLGACSGSTNNPGDDGGAPDDSGGKDATGGDSGGKDSGTHDATMDAHDGSAMDAADGSGGDSAEGGDDATDGSTDATQDGGDDASGDAADAADSSDSSNPSDANLGDAGSVYGNIFFENVPNFHVGVVNVTFYSTPEPLFVGCTTTAYGACTHYDCPGQPDAGAPVSAGTLTATGGALGNGVMITQGIGGSYQYQSMSSLMSQGDTMGISASGGTIPAFGPVDVVATGLITVTAPVPNGMGIYTINTAQDLSLAWSGGEMNALALFEVSATFGQSNRGAVCFFDATIGSGSLPAAAMSNLTGGSNQQFVYGEWRETDFTAGAYPLRTVAIQLGEGQANLQ